MADYPRMNPTAAHAVGRADLVGAPLRRSAGGAADAKKQAAPNLGSKRFYFRQPSGYGDC